MKDDCLFVASDSETEYKPVLFRNRGEGRQEMNLFQVTVSFSGHEREVYVIAENMDGAMAQAECLKVKVSLASGEVPLGSSEAQAKAIDAKTLPLLLRGWGGDIL